MSGSGDPADREFCRVMLPKVSRTFALGIRLGLKIEPHVNRVQAAGRSAAGQTKLCLCIRFSRSTFWRRETPKTR